MIIKVNEDTVRKSNGKWTNRGKDGEEHGEFKTKKQADAQRKAIFANGYKGESIINEGIDDYEIYTISMDVAVPKGGESQLDEDTRYLGNLYNKISSALVSSGYDMAGDYIEYQEGNTEVYQDSGYEFFEALGAGSYPDSPYDAYDDTMMSVDDIDSIKYDIDDVVTVADSNEGYIYVDSEEPTSKYYIRTLEGYIDLSNPDKYLFDEE